MKAGFVIEDNFIKVSYLENNGKITVYRQSNNKSDYESTFILEENFCYTTMTLEKVKLAKPKLNIFSNVLTNPEDKYTTAKGRIWSSRQLMAILFKKIIHDINANSIDEISSVSVAIPPDIKDGFKSDIELCFKANGIIASEYYTFEEACHAFVTKENKHITQPIYINLSGEQIYILGEKKLTISGFGVLDELLIKQLEKQNNIKISDHSEIEQYLITSELHKIKEQILKNVKKEEYVILLKDRYLRLSIHTTKVKEIIQELLENVKQTLLDCKTDAVTITGRIAMYELVLEICKELFTNNEFAQVIIDSQNEIKARGLLIN